MEFLFLASSETEYTCTSLAAPAVSPPAAFIKKHRALAFTRTARCSDLTSPVFFIPFAHACRLPPGLPASPLPHSWLCKHGDGALSLREGCACALRHLPISFLPLAHSLAHCLHHSSDLVARNTRVRGAHQTVVSDDVTMANPTRVHLHLP